MRRFAVYKNVKKEGKRKQRNLGKEKGIDRITMMCERATNGGKKTIMTVH